MIIYRSVPARVRPRLQVEALHRAVRMIREDAQPGVEHARDILIDVGRLESALLDAWRGIADGWGTRERALRAATRAAAWLLHATLSNGAVLPAARRSLLEALDALGTLELPDEVDAGTPEGYAWYALYPESFAAAALRVAADRSPGRALVIGIRGIGTGLSAVVATELSALGWRVESCTVRPVGHPYDRVVALDESLAKLWSDARDGLAVIVDEGPGRSGSSFAAAAECASAAGFSDGRIVLVSSAEPDLNALVSSRGRERFARHVSVVARFEDAWHDGARLRAALDCGPLLDLSAGRWRRVPYTDPAEYPAVHPRHERRKYLAELHGSGRAIPARISFAGFGAHGRAAFERATTLARAGWGPQVLGHAEGFLAEAFVSSDPLTRGSADEALIDAAARYLAFVRAEWPVRHGTPFELLLQLLRVNVRAGLGDTWADRMERLLPPLVDAAGGFPPILLDNRMVPHAWRRVAGMPVKTGGFAHGDDHFFPGPTDIAWDVAAFAIEFGLDDEARAALLSRFAVHAGESIDAARLAFFELLYAAFRLGYAHDARAELEGTPEAWRHARAVRRYRSTLARTLARLSDHAPSARIAAPHPLVPWPRLIVFDADDTLRRTTVPGQPCPRAPGEWELLPGVSDALRTIAWGPGGTRLGIASNQDQVAYGLLDESTARALIEELVVAALGEIPPGSSLQICPHLPGSCECCKPQPGMLNAILAATGVPAREALFVGNAETDREAALRAGMRFMWAHDFFARIGQARGRQA